MSKDHTTKPGPSPDNTKGYPGINPPKPQTGNPSTPPPKQPVQPPKKP